MPLKPARAEVTRIPTFIASKRSGAARIAAFLLLIGVLALLLHCAISAGLRRIQTSDFGVANRIAAGEINARILITGSSRALNHYDPRAIEALTGLAAYNIGLNGSQTDFQLARLKTYLRHNQKPLLIIHNLDVFSFQVTRGGVYDPGQYVPYLDEEPIYGALDRVNPDIWKSRYIPLYGYAVDDLRFNWMLGVQAAFGRFPAEDRFAGFMPRDLHWTGDFERFKSTHQAGLEVEVDPKGVQQMEELAAICRDAGIRLLFVYSPEYREMQSMTKNRADIFKRFRQLSERFDASFWDFSDDPLSTDRGRFYNSQHMNRSGAAAFSAELARRLPDELKLVGASSQKFNVR